LDYFVPSVDRTGKEFDDFFAEESVEVKGKKANRTIAIVLADRQGDESYEADGSSSPAPLAPTSSLVRIKKKRQTPK
jgi:hypothetical protein